MTEEVTLAPCPFCGGEGLPHRVPHLPKLYRIACKNCDAGPSASFDSYQAIAAWNARANQPPAQDGLVEALELAFDFACKVNALLTPLKSEWQDVNMWTDYDEGVFQMRPKVTMALQAALSAIKGDKS